MRNNILSFILFPVIIVLALYSGLNKSVSSWFVFLYLSAVTGIFILFRSKSRQAYQIYKEKSDEQEARINIAENKLNKKNLILKQLPPKAERVFAIQSVVEKLVEMIDPYEVCRFLVGEMSRIFPAADNVMLFLFHPEQESLTLKSSIKKSREVIKEKKGDIFDWWVLRNNQSLVIMDVESDFRFDSSNTHAVQDRQARSIIGSPLAIGTDVYGVIRLESKTVSAFTLEDSRVVRAISDAGVVVLERARLFRTVRELAIKDSLTGLFLKSYFLEFLEKLIEVARVENTSFAVCILDIDDFKEINDSHGHTVGDMVLRNLSKTLRENVKHTGSIIARFGGEEFVFLLPDISFESAQSIAETVRFDTRRHSVKLRRKQVEFTVSIGGAMFPIDGTQADKLLTAADRRLYRAKREGKNKVYFRDE